MPLMFSGPAQLLESWAPGISIFVTTPLVKTAMDATNYSESRCNLCGSPSQER